MQQNTNGRILSSLLTALRPIARFLMKAGIGYREFSEISKCAFVDVATTDYGLRGRPTNISRVAVMTGLTRKEVKRLRDKISNGTQVNLTRVIPPAEILERWHVDEEFLTEDDRPMELKFDGPHPSFASLVRKYGGDIPPGAMRTELKRVKAIVESKNEMLRVTKRHFRPQDVDEQLKHGLNHALYGVALALDHNLGVEPDKSWVERQAYSSRIRQNDINRVRRISQDRASEFIESIDDLFSAYETIYADDEEIDESSIVGVGVYYFESNEEAANFGSV
ncbi:MAG: DUF6502 family protein [Pseudomonadales bacterium]